MPLTASQVRVIIVIVISCVAINLVLYTSAVFSVTSSDQRNQVVLNSLGEDVDARNDDHDEDEDDTSYRVTSKPSFWHRVVRNDASPKKSKPLGLTKERTRFVSRSSSSQSFSAGGNGGDGENGDGKGNRDFMSMLQEDAAGNSSLKLATSTNAVSSVLRVHNGKKKKGTSRNKGTSTTRKPSDKDDFNIDTALRLFEGCIVGDDDISIDCFNDAYLELSKLFKPLGTIFSFVTSEIRDKISILREYRQHAVLGPQFSTLRGMVRYEIDHKLTVQKDKPSGSRTFLRLHWALQFMSALVSRIRDADKGSKISKEVSEAYDQTLAKHHPWYMRKAVRLATYTLPDKAELLVKLHMKDTPEDVAKVRALLGQLDAIYKISQILYVNNHLEDLP